MKSYITGEGVNALLMMSLLFFSQFLFSAGEAALGPYKAWMAFIRETGLASIFERVADQYGPGTYLVLAFAAAYLAGCLCKYQPLIFAPILAACLLRRLIEAWRSSPERALKLLGALALPTIILLSASFVIFGPTWPLSGARALESGTSA